MEKHVSTVIDWRGSYDLKEAQKVTWHEDNNGLYMFIGRTKGQRKDRLQYVGIAEKYLYDRFHKDHHIIKQLDPDTLSIWIGEITSAGIPGKKPKKIGTAIDLSEWAMAYFLQLPLNDKKTKNPPTDAVSVYNRWWKKDYETPRRRPRNDWPDLIDFVGHDYDSRLMWSGRIVKWPPEDNI